MRIVLMGSGNVATHLGKALHQAGHSIGQVYSRTVVHAQALAQQLHATPITDLCELDRSADWYILSIKDDALLPLIEQLPVLEGLVTHTAGSVPLAILSRFQHHGVFYPFQTFSKSTEVDFKTIPLLVEGNAGQTANTLLQLAQEISDKAQFASSDQRGQLHIAAVFACNFVNHMYALADDLLKSHQLPFDLLIPLIKETAAKMEQLSPQLSQTGPASRNDQQIIQKHIQSLEDQPHHQELYKTLTKSILDKLSL